jgi:hypothetical protein
MESELGFSIEEKKFIIGKLKKKVKKAPITLIIFVTVRMIF